VGRTGKITYVANLKPVFLSGSNIMNASLHNANYIKSKDIRVGDIVNLIKAGDIIPYIISSDKNERKRELEKFSEIIFCPSCNSILVNDDIVVDQFCINENCHEKILTSIEYFASNNAMNIMNLSSKYIEKFMKLNIVNNYSDLYNLENHKDLIINAEISIKDKMFNKLINSINESKKNSLERLITGFGIKNIGGSVSKILAKKFKNINNLMNAELNELNDIFIIGEKSAKNIFDFFKNEKNIKIINQLIEYGINTNYLSNNSNLEIYLENSKNIENEIYFNKSFVITGTFEIDRNLIKKIIEEIYEGKILSTVTKKIDFLIVGENPGSKLKKAEELNIKVIEKI
jgi:DNA ligase (NAD+)